MGTDGIQVGPLTSSMSGSAMLDDILSEDIPYEQDILQNQFSVSNPCLATPPCAPLWLPQVPDYTAFSGGGWQVSVASRAQMAYHSNLRSYEKWQRREDVVGYTRLARAVPPRLFLLPPPPLLRRLVDLFFNT